VNRKKKKEIPLVKGCQFTSKKSAADGMVAPASKNFWRIHRPFGRPYSRPKEEKTFRGAPIFFLFFPFGSLLMNTDMVALIDPGLNHPSSVAQLNSFKP
jgi:hypothetical protein